MIGNMRLSRFWAYWYYGHAEWRCYMTGFASSISSSLWNEHVKEMVSLFHKPGSFERAGRIARGPIAGPLAVYCCIKDSSRMQWLEASWIFRAFIKARGQGQELLLSFLRECDEPAGWGTMVLTCVSRSNSFMKLNDKGPKDPGPGRGATIHTISSPKNLHLFRSFDLLMCLQNLWENLVVSSFSPRSISWD